MTQPNRTEPNRTEPKTSGCLLCGRYFKNDHGASIHIGKTHNKRPDETEVEKMGGLDGKEKDRHQR
jgi:hypothetical protein